MTFYNIIQFVVIGIAGGFMGGFLGVGAAIIMVPLLIYWALPALQVPPDLIVHLALGTSMAIIIPTAMSSSLAHWKAGNVTWRTVNILVITGLVGSYLGATAAAKLSGNLLKALFGVFLTILAAQMFLEKKGSEKGSEDISPGVLPTLVIGFLVGFFSGFFGVGGGVLAIPLMVRFLRIPVHRAVGISISFAFFASIVGTWGYIANGWGKPNLPAYSLGYVYAWGWILAGIPSIFSAQWGAKWVRKTNPILLRQAFALLLIIVGVRMLLGSLRLVL